MDTTGLLSGCSDSREGDRRLSPAAFFCLLYLLVLPWNVKILPPVCLEDIVGAIGILAILPSVASRIRGRDVPSFYYLFGAFAVVMLAVTAVHSHVSEKDLFEVFIFLYMIGLFFLFRETPLNVTLVAATGGVTLLAFLFAAVFLPELSFRCFSMYRGTSLEKMSYRFYFTFDQPNMLGSLYFLPVLSVCTYIAQRSRKGTGLLLTIAQVFLVAVTCLPLYFTYSKHQILTIGVLSGTLLQHPALARKRWVLTAALLILFSCFLLFFSTVMFAFFPLKNSFPFINTSPGMYTIQQHTYWKMLTSNPGNLVTGVGKDRAVSAYPSTVDTERASRILAAYGASKYLNTFTSYVDPHNAFLDVAVSFGVPAMVLLYTGVVMVGVRAASSAKYGRIAVFLVVSIFMASFWGDILSKRWIWVGLGMLSGFAERDIMERGDEEGRIK